MNIYNKGSIVSFYKKHADAEIPLEIWYEEVESKTWKTPNRIKQEYKGNVSILKNSRAVFNIKGNDYRLVAAINYENGWVFIKFIGTHQEYDDIDSIRLICINQKMNVEIIKNKRQYNKALQRFEEIFFAKSNTKEGKEAQLLALVIKDYEDKHFKIDAPDPVEVIKFRMEQKNISKQALAEILGYNSRVSEVLNRKRKLTLEMVRNLHEKLDIPLESLVQAY
jgi:HTH-type transcriptional regulator/antitoxin HigA